MESALIGKYVIYTTIEYVDDKDNLDISRCQTIIPFFPCFDTRKEALDEMIFKLMEMSNGENNNIPQERNKSLS